VSDFHLFSTAGIIGAVLRGLLRSRCVLRQAVPNGLALLLSVVRQVIVWCRPGLGRTAQSGAPSALVPAWALSCILWRDNLYASGQMRPISYL
jgi:hypothetical protein